MIYINDICESSSKLSFFLFADDTTLFYSHKDTKVIQEIFNRELITISDWLKANKLSLNVKKTNVLLFRTTKHFHTQKFQITINNTVVDEKVSAKYLGVYLDNRLLFDEHCSHVLTRLQKSNAILAKTRHYVPKPVLRNIYFAHIQPHIDYGLSVWGNALKTHIKPMLNAQRKAVRLLAFQPKKSTDLNTHFIENKILFFALGVS